MKGVMLGLILVWLVPQEGATAGPRVRLRVAQDGWGEASPADVSKVLESAGGSLWSHAPSLKSLTLEVSRTKGDPITLFDRGASGEIRIKLDADGFHWAQFAFQFAHEVGHVLSGFADYPNPNLWFEETMSEAASLFALGAMAKAWEKNPPYPNWKGYSASLLKYRDERLAPSKLPEGTSLVDWFHEHEGSLRKDPRQRRLNLLLASQLFPLFEEDPGRWDALGTLNAVHGDSSRTFAQYLRDWSRSAAEKHRPFIRALADRLGVVIAP